MQHKAGVYYRKPMQSKSNIPVKKFGSDAYSAAPEQKKKDNKISQYAVITSASLQEQRQLYDDILNIKKEYDSEIEQITLENRNINDIFLSFSSKWIQNLDNKINITNSSLDDAMSIFDSIILRFESRFNQFRDSYASINEENQNLKIQALNEKKLWQTKSNECEQLKKELESYRTQSKNENQDFSNLQLANQQLENQLMLLQNKFSSLNTDYSNIQNQYSKLNDLNIALQNETKEKDNIINDLKLQIETNKDLSSVFDMNQQNLIKENKILKEKLDVSYQMTELLKNSSNDSSELQKKTKEIENLRNLINTKDLEIEQLKNQMYDFEKKGSSDNNDHIDAFQEQIAIRDQRIDELNDELEQKNKKINDLTNQLNQGDSLQDFVDSLSKIADDNEQSKALRDQIKQKDDIIEALRDQINLKDEELNSLKEVSNEISDKNNLIDKKDALINNLQQHIEKMSNEITSKIDSIEELQLNNKDQEETISNLSVRLDEKDQMIDNLESQITTCKKEIENYEKENIEMKSQIDSVTTLMHTMETRNKELESTSSNEREILNEEISQLKQKCHMLDLQNEEKQSLINEKESQIEVLTSRQASYMQKLKEGDQLAIENEILKTDFEEQKQKLEATILEKEKIEKKISLIQEEKSKISLEFSQVEYDKNKLLEKVQEYEIKFDKNLEEEKNQLSQYVKELEEQILILNVKSQKATLLENQIKNYDNEVNNLKMMLDTYKKVNEVLQEKLDQSNKQNNELISRIANENKSQFNQMTTNPTQKCTIACSPFKFDNGSNFSSNDDNQYQEILNENNNLKKEIEKWMKIVNMLKNNIHNVETDRNFYQSECGKLNSMLSTNDYDQDESNRIIKEKDNEISQLNINCENLRNEISKTLMEKKELNESFKSVSLKLTSAEHSYEDLRNQYRIFFEQLSNILHKNTEQEIIFHVIYLINSSRNLKANNENQYSAKIQYHSMSHIYNIESKLREIIQKMNLTISSFTRIDRKIQLTSRKLKFQKKSQIANKIGRQIPATERKKALSPLINRSIRSEESLDIPRKGPNRNDWHFNQRSDPSNFGDITPKVKKLIYT